MTEHYRNVEAMQQLWKAIECKSVGFKTGEKGNFLEAKDRFEQIEREYGDQKAVVAKALLHKAECLEQLDQHDDALGILDSVAREFINVDVEAVAAAHRLAGYILATVPEDYGCARERFAKAMEYTGEPVVAAESQLWIGNCWLLQQEYQKATEAFEEAAKISPLPLVTLKAEDMIGTALVLEGRLEAGSDMLTKVRQGYSFLGEAPPERLETEQVLELCTAGRYGLPQLGWHEELELKGYRAWVCDSVRGSPIWCPLYASVFCDYAAHGTQHAAAILPSLYTAGWDWRLIQGYPYFTVIEVKDEEVPERDKRFREGMARWIQNPRGLWDKDVHEIVELYKPIKDADVWNTSSAELPHLFFHCLHVYRRLHEIHSFWDFATSAGFGLFEAVYGEVTGSRHTDDPLFAKLLSGFDNILFRAERDAWRLGNRARELGLADVFLSIKDDEDVIRELELSEAGTAFGKNGPFVPNGAIFKKIVEPVGGEDESFGIDDLYAAYQLLCAADKLDFGRGAAKSTRRQTKFLFYMIVIDLLKDVMTRAEIAATRKNCTRALLKLFDGNHESAAQALPDAATEVVDGYLTSGTDNCVFDEPAYKNTFNHDLNAFLKWEKLGKTEEDCPRFRNLLAVNKVAMGQKVGGQPSMRETIRTAIVS